MPDLIRLLHGNPSGLKKLVKEFNMYWKKKNNPGMEESSVALDSSKLDMSMEVDKKTDKDSSILDTSISKTLNDSKIESSDEFSISKRQLEMKMTAIAVREKRADLKKICWYVNADKLKQYSMEDIKLPNTWEYVCIKEPKWAVEKVITPKVEDVAAKESPVPVKPAQSIMQFAQPMTLTEIQAQAAAKAMKEAPVNQPEKSYVAPPTDSQNDTPGKSIGPDQKTIKDMFSPAARKSLNCVKSANTTGAKLTPTKPAVTEKTKITLTPISKAAVSNEASPDIINKASTPVRGVVIKTSTPVREVTKPSTPVREVTKPLTPLREVIRSSMQVKGVIKPSTQVKEVTPVKDTHNSPGLNVLKNVLTSPELMTTSPKQAPAVNNQGTSEEPMDVEIIMID